MYSNVSNPVDNNYVSALGEHRGRERKKGKREIVRVRKKKEYMRFVVLRGLPFWPQFQIQYLFQRPRPMSRA